MTTRIIRKKIINGKSTDQQEIIESLTIKHDGRELAEVDFTETTAWSNFCKIRFAGSNEEFWIPSYRLIYEEATK